MSCCENRSMAEQVKIDGEFHQTGLQERLFWVPSHGQGFSQRELPTMPVVLVLVGGSIK